jgi:hypothetical protein
MAIYHAAACDAEDITVIKRSWEEMILTLIVSVVFAGHIHHEKYYQEQWCNDHGGVMEYALDDKSRVDCLTDVHAIEVEFAPKWKEAIGQALYYGIKTKRKPGIVVIIENINSDQKHLKRLRIVTEEYGIDLYEVAP